jgi:hypothetical protein
MRNLAAGANFLCIPFENRSDDGLAEASGARVLVGDNQRYKPNTLKFLEVAGDPALGALTGHQRWPQPGATICAGFLDQHPTVSPLV